MEVMEPSARYLTKPAYKQTEVGEIPEDWVVRPLKALTDPKRPISYGIVQTGPSIQNGVRCLRVVDIDDGRVNRADLITTSQSISNAYKRTVLQSGDLVMPLRGKVGDVALVDDELTGCNLTRGVALIAILRDHSALYCKHFIASAATRTRLTQSMNGSALQEIPIAPLRTFEIALPSTLAEQQAIAEALSDADALVESLEQLLAKKRQIKQGAMQELLTGQKRLPGFAGEWKTLPFERVLQRINAKAHQIQSSNYLPIGLYPVVDQGKERVVAFSDQHEQCFKCPEGGVIVFGDHTCIIKYIDFDFVVGADGTQVLKGKEDQCTAFHAFQLEYDGIQPTGYNRHFRLLKERDFLVPTLSEQTAIATLLSDMDAEIAALEAKLAKVSGVKQGMMQELLTGRIRLVRALG